MTTNPDTLLDAITLAVGTGDQASELRRISIPGTTSTPEGADCRNVIRNIANVLDGTWTEVPSSAADAFERAAAAVTANPQPHHTPEPERPVCPDCGGRGTRDFDDGAFIYDAVRPCSRCNGSGVAAGPSPTEDQPTGDDR